MIVLDLEWNQPFGGRRMEEIIQIGAVRLAEPGGAVQDWFNMHIRPSIYPKLSPVARKLPESVQALTAELDFPAAYQAFLDWCGDDSLWAEWGAQDHGVLAANAAYWRMPEPPVTACVDLQAAFGRTLGIGIGRRVALEQAAEYCGIPLIYEFHNALYDALYDMLGAETFQKYQERGSIEVAPLAYMRGRTLDDSFIILDEAQNTTREQMKMFLTRLGFGSKIVITGDVTQIDLPDDKVSGLKDAVRVLDGVKDIAICRLTAADVVRHALVQEIISAYERSAQKKEVKKPTRQIQGRYHQRKN